MNDRDDERDLLATVDGQLDGDPAFRQALEADLRRNPELAARMSAYAAQNAALRAAYDGRLAEPVPPRLIAALEPRPRRVAPVALRAACGALVLTLAGAGGWLLGERSDADRAVETLISRSFEDFTAERPSRPEARVIDAAVAAGRPLGWLRDEIEIRLGVPDLSALGYAVVEKRQISFGPDDQVVRLDYAGDAGTTFSLFLAPRWDNRPGSIVELERDGVSSAHWVEGPLASTVLSRLPADETRRIAEAARRAMADGGDGPPTVQPGPVGPQTNSEGVVADAAIAPEAVPPLPAGALVVPPQLTSN